MPIASNGPQQAAGRTVHGNIETSPVGLKRWEDRRTSYRALSIPFPGGSRTSNRIADLTRGLRADLQRAWRVGPVPGHAGFFQVGQDL